MLHAVSIRGKFLVAALVFFLISILLVFILPFAVSETVYNRNEHLLLAMPFSNIVYLAICLAAIFICIILLAYKRTVITILLLVVVTIGAVFISSQALTGYISFQEDGITIKELWQVDTIRWDEVTEVWFEYEGNSGDFTFTFKDGSQYVLPHSGSIGTQGTSIIYRQANAFGIPYIEKSKQ